MKRILALVVGLAVVAGSAFAATSDSHTVTLGISAIKMIAINGGAVTLTINEAATTGGAGAVPSPVDNSTANKVFLNYTIVKPALSNSVGIDVSTTIASAPAGTQLMVVASGGDGTPTAAVDISAVNTSAPLVDGIGAAGGYNTGVGAVGTQITYTLSVTSMAALVAGATSAITVTYTLVDE